jgi:hypothetical protein
MYPPIFFSSTNGSTLGAFAMRRVRYAPYVSHGWVNFQKNPEHVRPTHFPRIFAPFEQHENKGR